MRAIAWMALAVCAVGAARAQAVKDLPKPTDYVSDDAHVMSQAAIAQLDQLCGEVDREAHAKIIVLTIHTTNGEPIEQYAVDLEDAWKVGFKGSDRSVIILVAVQDRHRFIQTGYGMEGILPDGRVGDIGRQMVPALRANDFDGALTLATDEIAQVIAKDANVQLQALTKQGAEFVQQQAPRASVAQVLGGIVFLVLVVIFLVWAGGSGLLWFLLGMFFSGGGFGGGFGGGGFGGGGSGFGGLGGSGSTGGGGAGGSW